MVQQPLSLLGRLDGPAVVPTCYVQMCDTYRQAVRLCWDLRRVKRMTVAQLAIEAGLVSQHVSDYINLDDKPGRRNLPAQSIAAFEAVVGNSLITQWLAAQSRLTVLEEIEATRKAA